MIGSNWILSFISLCIGAISSVAYLGILWLSVKKMIRGKYSIVLAILGFFARLGLIGICLIFIAKWFHLIGILSYLFGFFIVKIIAQRKGVYGYHH
jgi:hypothetical protein